ncbi:protein mono-ADP-ribosyltransferase PARP14-like [Littorina saxatilis]|uniref:protein mono-ADP-ribosyltransferase PARP14-like n=1 Tax=Littorina saxatilis TaxID=31220 RepID=UPI0038B57C02
MGVISRQESEAWFTGTSLEASQVPAQVEPQPPRTASAPRPAIKKRSPQMVVTIVPGEIAQQQVDVIVNSTSTDLELRSGAISSSILQAAGVSLQTECKSKYPSGIKSGEIAITKGHALSCKEVYHLSLLSWAGPHTKQLLHQTTMECLAKCDKSGHTSIAIPALGTGNLSYPKDEVAQTMIGAVRQFQRDNPSTSLREVKLVVYYLDTQILQAFQQAIGQQPATAAVSNSSRPAFGPASGGHLTMSIVTGEIAQQKVSVIVNSTTRTLDLSSGAVSSSILQAAGVSLQTECNTKYPNGIKIGEIAVTKGHALACKELYHLSLPTWAGPHTKQVLHQTVMDCLTKCNQSGFTSIAIPALGTGNLSYPRDEVAQTMIGAVRQFEQTCPSSVLREVKLVVYHKDTQTVQQFQKYQNIGVRQLSSSPSTQQPATNRRANRTFSGPTEHKDGLGATSADYDWECDVMGVQVRVRKGDISEEDATAILRMTNIAGNNKDLADEALRSKCGKQLDEELRHKHAEIEDKGVAVTGALGLECSFLVHIDAKRFSKDVSSGIKTALGQANTTYGARSVAISTLGIAPEKLGSELFKAMSKFFSTEKDRRIREVRVILRDKLQIPQFKLAMEKHLNKQKDGNSLWTTSKRLFQAAKQKLSGTQTTSPVAEERRQLASAPWTTMARKGTKLYIYAENEQAVRDFLEAFNDRVKDRVQCITYKEDALRSMKSVQSDTIRKIAAEHDVGIEIWPEQGRYELKGLINALPIVHKRINEFVKDAEHRKRESEQESFIKGIVQWSYLEVTLTGTEKLDYDPKENKIIETAFLDKMKTAEIVDSKGITYVIEFENMVEYPQNDPSEEQRVQVIRKTRESDSGEKRLPSNWEPHGTNEQVKLVKLKTTDKEYGEVEDRLRDTQGNKYVTIVSVDRIQNVMLYQQYQAKKTNMDEQNGKGFPNEMTLWHGTATDAIQSINNHGFNRSYCGKNATVFGEGVYFAVKSSYSTRHTYSPPDSSGNRFLYQCKVLVGHPTVGISGMRVLPIRQDHVKYDTATNNLRNPEMYVIFNDTQAYPEYLIKFT